MLLAQSNLLIVCIQIPLLFYKLWFQTGGNKTGVGVDFHLLIRISKLLLENYLSSLWWCVFGFLFVWMCLLFVWVGLFVWVFFCCFCLVLMVVFVFFYQVG